MVFSACTSVEEEFPCRALQSVQHLTMACRRRLPASATLRCDQRARWSHTISPKKGKKGSTGKPDPAASRCRYPDVLRSNPRGEALGTMYRTLGASPGAGRGEAEKDEQPCRTNGRLVKRYTAKEAERQCQKAVGRSETTELSLRMPHTPTGLQVPSSFIRNFPRVHWGSPPRPTPGWYPNRKAGGRRRGARRAEKATASLSGDGEGCKLWPNPKGS
jgi:hypothetical protein